VRKHAGIGLLTDEIHRAFGIEVDLIDPISAVGIAFVLLSFLA
jgi:hypothetical protein